jgi:hypothetical protein
MLCGSLLSLAILVHMAIGQLKQTQEPTHNCQPFIFSAINSVPSVESCLTCYGIKLLHSQYTVKGNRSLDKLQ